jgi:hypothetical protein
MQNIHELIKRRNELESRGTHPGFIAEDRGSYRLFWKVNGKQKSMTIPKAELEQWKSKTQRYRQVKHIDAVVKRIEREVQQLLAEVAA